MAEANPAPAKGRRRRTAPAEAPAAAPPKEEKPADRSPVAPKRARLSVREKAHLSVRSTLDGRRPAFVRQAANRYGRIGRWGAWRRPRGLQSKQRRHYGYRAQIVRIGYRSPADIRGTVPSGFWPVLVHNRDELDGIEPTRQAAVIARTVGTRRRLVLEEEARRLGIHVLNPIVKGESEEA